MKIAGRIEVVAPLLKLVHFQAEMKSLFSLKQPVSLLKQLIPNHLQQAEHLMAEDSTHNGEGEHGALTPWLGLLGVGVAAAGRRKKRE